MLRFAQRVLSLELSRAGQQDGKLPGPSWPKPATKRQTPVQQPEPRVRKHPYRVTDRLHQEVERRGDPDEEINAQPLEYDKADGRLKVQFAAKNDGLGRVDLQREEQI